jgi:hypothetical protein
MKKIVPFLIGAAGVVSQRTSFGNESSEIVYERPPRLRRFGGFAPFY